MVLLVGAAAVVLAVSVNMEEAVELKLMTLRISMVISRQVIFNIIELPCRECTGNGTRYRIISINCGDTYRYNV
jgi:hypothetical protein